MKKHELDTPLSELTVGQLLNILNGKTRAANYLNTIEAAEMIKKTPNALRQIVHRREIPTIKRGNSLYFLESDLIEWMEKGRREY